jgi:hypothetical protein
MMRPNHQHCTATGSTVLISVGNEAPTLDRLTNVECMAGYSSNPLVHKLGIKPGFLVQVSHRPADVDVLTLIEPLPEGVRVTNRTSRAQPNLVICFAETTAELTRRLPLAIERISTDGMVWVWWPKKSSTRFREGARDLTEDTIRSVALRLGVVDVKVCAVDDTWSALKLVYRLADR